MNREIKFRGRCVITGNWAYGYYYQDKGHSIICNENGETIVMPKSVGQYTGLKDRYGKDIYEGDILFYNGTELCDMEVYFKDGAFWGKGVFTECVMDRYLNSYDFHSIEIIGNIYENPGMLETNT